MTRKEEFRLKIPDFLFFLWIFMIIITKLNKNTFKKVSCDIAWVASICYYCSQAFPIKKKLFRRSKLLIYSINMIIFICTPMKSKAILIIYLYFIIFNIHTFNCF